MEAQTSSTLSRIFKGVGICLGLLNFSYNMRLISHKSIAGKLVSLYREKLEAMLLTFLFFSVPDISYHLPP